MAYGNNPFANLISRKFGGTNANVPYANPYLNGTHFISFEVLPTRLESYVKSSGLWRVTAEASNSDIQNVLMASCMNVQAPGGRVAKIDFAGLGGIRWAVPGAVEYDNAVTVRFLEFSGLPVSSIIRSWVKMIRDYRTGLAFTESNAQGTYDKPDYSAIMYYFTTSPGMEEIEYYACYDGVFPVTDPQNLFSSDIENIGKVELDIEFNVDYIWSEPWVLSRCQDIKNTIAATVSVLKKGYNTAGLQ
jgi:hypothetical protein